MLTVKDLDTIALPPGVKYYELDEGELVPVSPATRGHEDVKTNLVLALVLHVEAHPIAKAYVEASFVLPESLERVPSIAVVLLGKLAIAPMDELFHFAPDLAIEILSPSQRAVESERKARQFLAAGTTEVWQVYPEQFFVCVRTTLGLRDYEANDRLETPLLPGFAVPVSSLFR